MCLEDKPRTTYGLGNTSHMCEWNLIFIIYAAAAMAYGLFLEKR